MPAPVFTLLTFDDNDDPYDSGDGYAEKLQTLSDNFSILGDYVNLELLKKIVDQAGTTAGRAAFDDEAQGFSYLDETLGTISFKNSATNADWSAGSVFYQMPVPTVGNATKLTKNNAAGDGYEVTSMTEDASGNVVIGGTVTASSDFTITDGKLTLTDTANEVALLITSSITNSDGFLVQANLATSGHIGQLRTSNAGFTGDVLYSKITHASAGGNHLKLEDDTGVVATIAKNGAIQAPSISFDGTNKINRFTNWTAWTPELWDNSLSGSESQTYTKQIGFYTVIADVLSWEIYMIMAGLGTLSSDTHLGNFPIAKANVTDNFNAQGSIRVGAFAGGVSQGSNAIGYMAPNTSHIVLTIWDLATGTSQLQISELTSTVTFMASGSYRIL